jgi:hypothetical protein
MDVTPHVLEAILYFYKTENGVDGIDFFED